jgi:hypothetical protein
LLWLIALGFFKEKKAMNFRRKLAKNADISDHNIGPCSQLYTSDDNRDADHIDFKKALDLLDYLPATGGSAQELVPILPKVTNIGSQISVTFTFTF